MHEVEAETVYTSNFPKAIAELLRAMSVEQIKVSKLIKSSEQLSLVAARHHSSTSVHLCIDI